MNGWVLMGTGLVVMGLGALGMSDTWQATGLMLVVMAVATWIGV